MVQNYKKFYYLCPCIGFGADKEFMILPSETFFSNFVR